MNGEVWNILKHCVNPLFAARLTLFFLRRIFFSLQYRYLPTVLYHSKEVKKLCKGIRSKAFTAPLSLKSEIGMSEVKGRLKLASGFLEFRSEADWKQKFDDSEQAMSLHRWNWLLYEDMSLDTGLRLMRSWLSVMDVVPRGLAHTSYTTGERIVSALLFFHKKKVSIPEDIRGALLAMAFHVARHLEYHGVRGTGNHVINNARALFFAGEVLDAPQFSELALAVMKEALPWLVTQDGFLREESSHYHILFTRWLLEIYELAKATHHEEMTDFMGLWAKQCAKQCWFFLVQNSETAKWQIPLFGDVSPDCTPEWLIEYLLPKIAEYKEAQEAQNLKVFPQSGWFRLDRAPYTLFWHVPQEGMVHRATHGHSDLCSFVLYARGKPVFIDPGRPTYKTHDPLYEYSGSARSHNSLTLDGFDPTLYDRAQKFPVFYQKREVKCEWRDQGQWFMFAISHTGFHRLNGDRIDHTRRFSIAHNSFEIEDEFSGKGSHTIETFFHFAPGRENIALYNSQGQPQSIGGWTSPAYGVTVPSKVVAVKTKEKFPAKVRHRFELLE